LRTVFKKRQFESITTIKERIAEIYQREIALYFSDDVYIERA